MSIQQKTTLFRLELQKLPALSPYKNLRGIHMKNIFHISYYLKNYWKQPLKGFMGRYDKITFIEALKLWWIID